MTFAMFSFSAFSALAFASVLYDFSAGLSTIYGIITSSLFSEGVFFDFHVGTVSPV